MLTTCFDFCAGQEGIRKGVELLRRCDEMVSKLGLFSTNETKEDVSTANLKYLLVCSPPSLCSVNKFMKQAIDDTRRLVSYQCSLDRNNARKLTAFSAFHKLNCYFGYISQMILVGI